MGYMRFRAMLITGFDEELGRAHDEALQIFHGTHLVSPICKSAINGYLTFMVAPDGSKLGWPESDLSQKKRDALLTWIREQPHSRLQWCEVVYGDDDGNDHMIRSSALKEDSSGS